MITAPLMAVGQKHLAAAMQVNILPLVNAPTQAATAAILALAEAPAVKHLVMSAVDN
jgi:hypothetical protein